MVWLGFFSKIEFKLPTTIKLKQNIELSENKYFWILSKELKGKRYADMSNKPQRYGIGHC